MVEAHLIMTFMRELLWWYSTLFICSPFSPSPSPPSQPPPTIWIFLNLSNRIFLGFSLDPWNKCQEQMEAVMSRTFSTIF